MRNILCFLLIGIACVGCSPRVVYLPREKVEVRHDTLRQLQMLHDSIRILDSVYVEQRGDTVRIERLRERVHERLRVDTIYEARIDTLTIAKTLPPENPPKPKCNGGISTLQKIMLCVALLLLLLYILKNFIKTRLVKIYEAFNTAKE